jgi:CRP-like cAMP-binding protein
MPIDCTTKLPQTLAAFIEQRPVQHFTVGAALLTPNERSNTLWWIDSGLVRTYALDAQGNSRNLGFHGPGSFLCGQLTLQNGQVCCGGQALGVSALVTTEAISVPLKVIDQMRLQDTQIADWIIRYLLLHSSSQQQHNAALLQRSATERYQELLQTQPNIAHSVALHQIADWLGITPVALSRIRRKLKANPGAFQGVDPT